MKIKKIMLGALAAATIATGIGVSNTPVFAAEESNVAVVSEVSTNTITPFPDSSLKDEQTFEHNGVKYIKEDQGYRMEAVANPQGVTDVFIYSHLFDTPILFESIFENYTNVERVVLNMNNPANCLFLLTDLTHEFDLFTNGQFLFSERMKSLPINDLYLMCPYYGNAEEAMTEACIQNLNGSSIKNIKYYDYSGNSFWTYNAKKLENANLVNSSGDAIKIFSEHEVRIAYPLEYF